MTTSPFDEVTPQLVKTPFGDVDPNIHSISYLRVSTTAQAQRDGEPEGLSIPAQRAAVDFTAASQKQTRIRRHFTDKGASARSSDRPGLKDMLDYLQKNRVDYVFVHKLDRLARNRHDDVMITMAIKKSGAQLVSCSENIDDSPSGMLVHGIMSSIAEYYSRNLSTESKKGMLEKAKRGGTNGRAPFGYLNVQTRTAEGFVVKSVELDPDRAAHARWIFETYAAGEETAASIAAALREQNVTTAPTPRRAAMPISTSHINAVLGNRFYVGVVTFDKTEYPGQHEPLVTEELFAKVQGVRAARHTSGIKPRVHNHYLKGMLHCGMCGEPLAFERTRNRTGTQYDYFYCLGRQRAKNGCTFRATQAHLLEAKVVEHWATVHRSDEETATIRKLVVDHIDVMLPRRDATREAAARTLLTLTQQSQKLLEAHYADAISLEDLKREQNRLAVERATVERTLAQSTIGRNNLVTILDHHLALLHDARAIYEQASNANRRQLNSAVFERLYVEDDDIVASDYQPVMARLTTPELKDILRNERINPLEDAMRTSVLSAAQRSLETATEVAERPEITPGVGTDTPSRARRQHPSGRIVLAEAIERPRGRLPWEKKEPRSLKDRGSNSSTLVAGTGFEPATSGL